MIQTQKLYSNKIIRYIVNNPNRIVFLLFCLLAFFNVEDLGVSWDEWTQRAIGFHNYEYIFSDNKALLTFRDRDYGAFFELILVSVEKLLGFDSPREIIMLRHSLTHLFFIIAANYLYRLILFIYNNRTLALIGMIMLLLTPRIYAHSFFNTKDIPFMSMFIIALYYTAIAFDKKTLMNFIKLGLVVGALINIRIMGLMLLVLIPLQLLIDAIDSKQYKFNLWRGLLFVCSSFLTLYATWPYMWESPLNLFQAFSNMSKFRWDGTLLFAGEIIQGVDVKWNYIPIWFSITTPIVFWLIGVTGLLYFAYQIVHSPAKFLLINKHRNLLIHCILFIGPIAMVIILKSVLYDDWRQMYFIYPCFILIAIALLNSVNHLKIKIGVYLALTITFIFEAYFISFKTEQTPFYFNGILSLKKGNYLSENFEMDYWGTSFKKTLEMLADYIETDTIKIFPTNPLGDKNIEFLENSYQNRFKIVSKEEATYLITNYKNKRISYEEYKNQEVLSLNYQSNKVCTVFKLNDND